MGADCVGEPLAQRFDLRLLPLFHCPLLPAQAQPEYKSSRPPRSQTHRNHSDSRSLPIASALRDHGGLRYVCRTLRKCGPDPPEQSALAGTHTRGTCLCKLVTEPPDPLMRTRLVRGEIAPHLRLRELKYLRLGLGMACRVQLRLQLRPANTAERACESRTPSRSASAHLVRERQHLEVD